MSFRMILGNIHTEWFNVIEAESNSLFQLIDVNSSFKSRESTGKLGSGCIFLLLRSGTQIKYSQTCVIHYYFKEINEWMTYLECLLRWPNAWSCSLFTFEPCPYRAGTPWCLRTWVENEFPYKIHTITITFNLYQMFVMMYLFGMIRIPCKHSRSVPSLFAQGFHQQLLA